MEVYFDGALIISVVRASVAADDSDLIPAKVARVEVLRGRGGHE